MDEEAVSRFCGDLSPLSCEANIFQYPDTPNKYKSMYGSGITLCGHWIEGSRTLSFKLWKSRLLSPPTLITLKFMLCLLKVMSQWDEREDLKDVKQILLKCFHLTRAFRSVIALSYCNLSAASHNIAWTCKLLSYFHLTQIPQCMPQHLF